jgi:regulatory protein
MQKKFLTSKQAYLKASRFCAYQERTQQEVREKLRDLGIYGDQAEEIISQLILDNFINEERFAQAFAGGKFRIKKWGRVKIEYALKQKGLSPYCIKKGMAEIEEDDYEKTLLELIAKKFPLIQENNIALRKQKLAQYLIGKGYESDLIWTKIKQLLN